MPGPSARRPFQFVALLSSAVLLCSLSVFGQKAPSAPSASSGGRGTAGTGTGLGNNGSYGSNSGNRNSGSTINNGQQSTIFLSGRVMFDNGQQPDRDIRIERVCGGTTRLEAHTDSKGRFSFQLGQNLSISDFDAADSSGFGGGARSNGSGFGNGRDSGLGSGSSGGLGAFSNCELRAAYPGYRSDIVQLATRRALDNPDVGTIVLHHLGDVQGTTISLTTALAPKDARKEYEKGMQLAAKGKFEEAQQRLAKATELYPKYAVAWYALGQTQQRQGHSKEARTAYQNAVTSDARYVSPYDQLALLAAQEGNWEQAANFSKQAVSLNPVEFPTSFWYNAMANYNLKRVTDAERSTRNLLKLDTQHHFPDAENMMAQILLDQGKYPEAASRLRTYLQLVPEAKNADTLKQMLLKIDAASAAPPPAPSGAKP